MRRTLRSTMDALYWAAALIAAVSLVLIVGIIPYGVYTRYVLDSAASWPEPAAILLTIVLTFFGAAIGYRNGTHMRVTVLRDNLPPALRPALDFISEALVAVIAAFMMVWGARLCAATWHQTIAEFPAISTGLTYLPIPIGGALTLLFIAERLLIGLPPQEGWRRATPD
jgi:TRAP-type C4-dicarboxylate transport system permease small subunit